MLFLAAFLAVFLAGLAAFFFAVFAMSSFSLFLRRFVLPNTNRQYSSVQSYGPVVNSTLTS